MIILILHLVSTFSLGLLVGSLLTEALVFIPLWKNTDAKYFLKFHPTAKPIIYNYFKPLTIVATSSNILVLIIHIIRKDYTLYNTLPGGISILLLVIYFIFFKDANNNFSDGTLSEETLPMALDLWGKWHWLRTILGLSAFLLALINLVTS